MAILQVASFFTQQSGCQPAQASGLPPIPLSMRTSVFPVRRHVGDCTMGMQCCTNLLRKISDIAVNNRPISTGTGWPVSCCGYNASLKRKEIMLKLVLLRHGESLWNSENRFTGWTDVDLSETGRLEAIKAGQLLRNHGILFDTAYVSVLKRAIRSLWLVQE